MPVGEVTIIGAVLAHGRHGKPVLERQIPDLERLEQGGRRGWVERRARRGGLLGRVERDARCGLVLHRCHGSAVCLVEGLGYIKLRRRSCLYMYIYINISIKHATGMKSMFLYNASRR